MIYNAPKYNNPTCHRVTLSTLLSEGTPLNVTRQLSLLLTLYLTNILINLIFRLSLLYFINIVISVVNMSVRVEGSGKTSGIENLDEISRNL